MNVTSLWDILRVYKQFPQLGLLDNIIYDIVPNVPMAVDGVVVNATVFEVDCGVISTARQAGAMPWEQFFGGQGLRVNLWSVDIAPELEVKVDLPGQYKDTYHFPKLLTILGMKTY